jgi:Hsp70 protein
VSDAGVDPHSLAAVYLVGGASRMPLVERSVSEALPGVTVSRRGDPKTAVAVGATLAELSASVLDLQAAPTRTTLESDGGIRASDLPVAPPSPGSFDRATVGGSAEPVAAPPPPIAQPGTVIEPPSVVSVNRPPQPLGPPQQAQAAPPPFGQPHYAQPSYPTPAPPVSPASKTPLIAAGVAAGLLLLGGIGFAATRGGSKAIASTTTAATAPVGGGAPVTAGSTSSSSVTPITIKPITTTTTTTPPSTTVPPSPVTTVKAGVADRAFTNEQADSVLLSLADLASTTKLDGWIPGSFSAGPPLCGYATPNGTIEKHLVGDLKEANGFLEVTSGAFTYASVEDVNANYDALKLATTSCPDNKSVESNGTFTIAITPGGEPVVPGLDRTLLLGLTAQAPGLPKVQTVLVIGVRGRSAITLQYSFFGREFEAADTERTGALFALLVAKINAVP